MMPSNEYYDQSLTTNMSCGQPLVATGYVTSGYGSVPRVVVAGPAADYSGQEITMQPHHNQSHPQLDHQVCPASGPALADSQANNVHIYHLGIYGWKRALFYLLFAATVLLVIINCVLTIWIMTIIGLSTVGIRSGCIVGRDYIYIG